MVLDRIRSLASLSAGGRLLKLEVMSREPQDGYCRFTVPTSSSLCPREKCCPSKTLRVQGGQYCTQQGVIERP